jgi:hypothetical protein
MLGPAPSLPAATVPKRPERLFNRSWVETYIVSADGAAARKEVLDRRFGQAVRGADGFDRYASDRNGIKRIVTVDPGIAAIIEASETRNGVTSTTRFVYAKDAQKGATLSLIRTERSGKPSAAVSVSETRFENLHLEKR